MKLSYDNAEFMRCRACTEKTHCKQCGQEAQEALEERPDVESASIDMLNRIIVISAVEGADEDDLLDAMEEIGLFV